MKTVLIQPPQCQLKDPTAYIPLGIAYIAATLEAAEVDVQILNLSDNPDLQPSDIPPADWYGISCVTATKNTVKKLIPILDGRVVVGGPHPSVLPDETLSELKPDIVMTGESEFTFRDLVLGRIKPEPIMDAGFIEDLNDLPFPARHLFLDSDVVDRSGIHGQEKGVSATTVITSRGCPFNCLFCCKGHPMFNWYRYREAVNVFDELTFLKERYGIEHVRFVDDEFTLHKGRSAELMRVLRPLGFTWVCITRADTLDADLLRLMKLAGCTEVHIGVETGSDRLLRLMNKQTTSKVLKHGIDLIKEAGIRVKTYLMMNYPGETEEDREATIEFMRETRPDKYTISCFTPLPGSAIERVTRQKGKAWFYPDEDSKYQEYKKRIEEALQ